jgi:hypothetical protein
MVPQPQEAAAPQTLEGLADIVVPEPVSLTPQTAGWIILGVIVIALLATVAVLASTAAKHSPWSSRRRSLHCQPW